MMNMIIFSLMEVFFTFVPSEDLFWLFPFRQLLGRS